MLCVSNGIEICEWNAEIKTGALEAFSFEVYNSCKKQGNAAVEVMTWMSNYIHGKP